MNGAPSRYLLPEVLSRLGSLSLKARHVAEGVLAGLHRSRHHGASVEFAEHKEYSPGDDLRHLDWKAYGRLDKYYVKRFEQETSLQGYLLLDTSGSMDYRSPDAALSKRDYASVLAASLAYLLVRQSDAAGLLAFAEAPHTLVPPRGTSAHLRHITAALEAVEGGGGTDVVAALDRLAEIARRRTTVFLFSDLLDAPPTLLDRLRQLRSRRHAVAVFHVLDPWELTFPFTDLTELIDMEDAERRVVTDPRALRDAYLEEVAAWVDGLRRATAEADIDYVLASTDTPPARVLLRLLGGR